MKKMKFFFYLFIFVLTILLISVCAVPGSSSSGGGSGGGGDDGGTPSAKYTLTINIIGNGAVSPVGGTYDPGTIVTITATADTDYDFVQWLGDLTGNDTTTSITMDSNKTITAVFIEETTQKYTLTTNTTGIGNGSITKLPDTAEYYVGTVVTLTAVPDAGSKFETWSGDLSGNTNPTTITMDDNKTVTATFGQCNWTILIHFAVDNDIDYDFEVDHGIITDYLNTLESIEASDTNNEIQILVLMDSYDEVRFVDGYYALTGGNFSDDLVIDTPEINSGSVSDTTTFMDWVVANYPAQNYMYSVFNHGSGFDDNNISGTYSTYGIGFDDHANDCLSHYELGQATAYLKGLIGKNIDIFYTYACLMGGVELAYEVRNYADYLLFSEESFPADYWSYEALSNIISNPSISSLNLAKSFCDSAYSHFSGIGRGFTLSVIDLSTIDALYTAINGFAPAAIADIADEEDAEDYIQLAYSCLSMMRYYVPDYYYIDLGNFMSEIYSSTFTSSSVKSAATSINTAISNSIVYMREFDYPRATGISIFHNIKFSFMGDYSTTTYRNILTFGSSNSWANYIDHLDSTIDFTSADHYEPDNNSTNDNYLDYLPANNRPQYHTISPGDDPDWYSIALSTDFYTFFGFISGNDCITINVYQGTSAGPSTLLGAITSSTSTYYIDPQSSSGVYYWFEVSSKSSRTGMYRASMFQYSATLDDLERLNIKFNKLELK